MPAPPDEENFVENGGVEKNQDGLVKQIDEDIEIIGDEEPEQLFAMSKTDLLDCLHVLRRLKPHDLRPVI